MTRFTIRMLAAAGLLLLSSGSAFSSMTITDTHHTTAGGDWNNTGAGNWAIWYHEGNDPTVANPRPFINEPLPLSQDIPVTDGTHTYVLYKNNNGTSSDAQTVFSFAEGADTANITVVGNGAYQTSNVAPTVRNQSVTMGTQIIKIESFDWYRFDVFNKDFVGPNQSLGANGQGDDIGLLTITVVPEPSCLALLGLGGLGLLARRRGAIG